MRRFLFLSLFVSCVFVMHTQPTIAQRRVRASDRIAPRWTRKTPVSKSKALCYVPVTTYSTDLDAATILSLNDLCKYLPRNWNITTHEELTRQSQMQRSGINNRITDNRRDQIYKLQVQADGAPLELRCLIEDRYWEQVMIGGNLQYRNQILYQVAAPGSDSAFENASTTTSYGARGLWRSAIIPGWGQFHKGANLKGGLILGGCAVLAGGIVFTENQRSDYARKITRTHDQGLINSYATKRDHFATARNICIGAAAALYVYNLIDAIAAPGARRIKVSKRGSRSTDYSFTPVVTPDGTAGMTASVSF